MLFDDYLIAEISMAMVKLNGYGSPPPGGGYPMVY